MRATDKATALELAVWALEELSGELVDKLSGELNALNEPEGAGGQRRLRGPDPPRIT